MFCPCDRVVDTAQSASILLQADCLINALTGAAVKRWWSNSEAKTVLETGSLHPVAIRAAVEATKPLKPLRAESR